MSTKRHIIHLVSNRSWGGGEQYVYNLCSRLKADGYDVTLFTRKAAPVVERLSELGVPLHYLSLGGAIDFVSGFRLSRFLRHAGCCVVHVHNFKDAFTAVYASLLSGNDDVRVVVTRHLVRRGKGGALYRWLYRHIDCITFVSDLARREFIACCPPVAAGQNMCVVRNSIIVPEGATAVDVRHEFGIPAGAVVAMYHGRIAGEKGLDVLVEAMSELRDTDIHMLLIGTGNDDYVASLKRKIVEWGLDSRMTLAGFRHPVLPYLGGCDFGVLPSVVAESSSLACMEYMSQGRCVVATDNGGQAEYLADGSNALLVKAGDAQGLAAAMRRLAGDGVLRERLGSRARADFSERMSYNTFVERIKEIYEH